MKLVKGVRYGLTPIKRIYLGHDIVYDTRTFVLKYGYGDLGSSVKASLKEEPITNANMIYTVDMYVILAPEIYDLPDLNAIDNNGIMSTGTVDVFDDIGISAVYNDGIISACAVGTFDDVAFAASNSKLTDIIKNIIAAITANTKNAVVFSDDGLLTVGNGHSSPAKIVYGNSMDDIAAISDGHSAEAVKVYSVDNKICFATAEPNATRFIEIAGNCSRILACLGCGNNKHAVNAYSIDDKICTIIGDGKSNNTTNAEVNSILNAIVNADIGSDTQVFIDSNANLIIRTISGGGSVVPKHGYAHSELNIKSTLKVEDVVQSDIYAHGNLHINATLSDIDTEPVDMNASAKLKTTVHLKPDITQPYKVNLSGVINTNAKANSMTWHYPEQDGDVLFIFQAYEAIYNEETKTLEIK